jgi:hypothetical protein
MSAPTRTSSASRFSGPAMANPQNATPAATSPATPAEIRSLSGVSDGAPHRVVSSGSLCPPGWPGSQVLFRAIFLVHFNLDEEITELDISTGLHERTPVGLEIEFDAIRLDDNDPIGRIEIRDPQPFGIRLEHRVRL